MAEQVDLLKPRSGDHSDPQMLHSMVLAALEQALSENSLEDVAYRLRGLLPKYPDAEPLLQELRQILEAQTDLDSVKLDLRKIQDSLQNGRTNTVNDINLNRWKDYDNVLTDSLWIEPRRDSSGAHTGWYWGNFIPQIASQMMVRYTKRGGWVYDAFAGSGTTLIEGRRQGRNCVGVELSEEIAEKARQIVLDEPNPHKTVSELVVADSRSVDLRPRMQDLSVRAFDLAILMGRTRNIPRNPPRHPRGVPLATVHLRRSNVRFR